MRGKARKTSGYRRLISFRPDDINKQMTLLKWTSNSVIWYFCSSVFFILYNWKGHVSGSIDLIL